MQSRQPIDKRKDVQTQIFHIFKFELSFLRDFLRRIFAEPGWNPASNSLGLASDGAVHESPAGA